MLVTSASPSSMGFLVFMRKKKILFVKVCQLLSEKCMCYRKFKCRGKRVEPHSAPLPPANISNSIQASKVNRIYFKWVKCFFFFQMCCHLLWKQWKSLLGFCLSKNPAPFTLVGKASALTCGSLIPKVCETTLSMKQKMQAHVWRHLRQCWSAISRDHFPSCCSWMTRGRSPPPLRAGRVMKDIWQAESASPGVSWKSSSWRLWVFTLDKMATSQGKLSKTGGCWRTMCPEITRTWVCSESWNVTDKNN